MADIKVTGLNPAVASLSDSDLIHAVQGIQDVKLPLSLLKGSVSTIDNQYIAGGTDNTITLTPKGSTLIPENYFDGFVLEFVANYNNTGASTLEVLGLGIVNITYGSLPIAANTIRTGENVRLRYSSAISRFELLLSDTLKPKVDGASEASKLLSCDGNKDVSGLNVISSTSFVQGGNSVLDSSSIAIDGGTISNGGTIPLPVGFLESNCVWTLSWSGPVTDTNAGVDGMRCYTYNDGTTNRRVKSEFKHENGGWSGINANYFIIGLRGG